MACEWCGLDIFLLSDMGDELVFGNVIVLAGSDFFYAVRHYAFKLQRSLQHESFS